MKYFSTRGPLQSLSLREPPSLYLLDRPANSQTSAAGCRLSLFFSNSYIGTAAESCTHCQCDHPLLVLERRQYYLHTCSTDYRHESVPATSSWQLRVGLCFQDTFLGGSSIAQSYRRYQDEGDSAREDSLERSWALWQEQYAFFIGIKLGNPAQPGCRWRRHSQVNPIAFYQHYYLICIHCRSNF